MMRYLYLSSLLAILMTLIGMHVNGNGLETEIRNLQSSFFRQYMPPPLPTIPPNYVYGCCGDELAPYLEDHIFMAADPMPRFPGCADAFESDKKLLEFIYKNVQYPSQARKNGVQGRAIVQFIVERDGTITDVQCIRDIGAGCGEEAIRVVNSMNSMAGKWTPGKIKGDPVRVKFTLPISFKL